MTEKTFLLIDSRVSNVVTHRLPVIFAAKENGYDVHVTTLVDGDSSELDGLGITYHSIGPSQRRGAVGDFLLVFAFRRLMKTIAPSVCHFASLRAVLCGLLAAVGQEVVLCVCSVTGLGFLFIDENLKTRLQRSVVGFAIRNASRRSNTVFVFQNADDQEIFSFNGWSDFSVSKIIPGSGVDTSIYRPGILPTNPIVVLMPARFLIHKGIVEFIEAAKIVKTKWPEVEFWIAGDIDDNNPATVSREYIDGIAKDGTVKDLGYQTDMASLLQKTTIACLPSYREGLPKALLEAAAAGLALVTTDAVGCRDVVAPGVNGLLVKPKSATDLAAALETLIRSPQLIAEMGRHSREMVEAKFSASRIEALFGEIYRTESD